MIVDIHEQKDDTTLSCSIDGLNSRAEFDRVFDVSIALEGAETVADILMLIQAHEDLPALGDSHPNNIWATVDNITVRNTNGNSYRVVVHYMDIGNPAMRVVDASYGSNITTESIDKDINNNPLENSSGEQFTVDEDFHDATYSASGYSLSWSASNAASYRNTTNNATWFSNPIGTCRVVKYDAEPVYISGSKYWKWYLEIHFRTDGWDRRILDQGTMTKDATTGLITIKDADGNPVTSPVKLNGSGGVLADGSAAVYRTFQTKSKTNFALLPLTLQDVT